MFLIFEWIIFCNQSLSIFLFHFERIFSWKWKHFMLIIFQCRSNVLCVYKTLCAMEKIETNSFFYKFSCNIENVEQYLWTLVYFISRTHFNNFLSAKLNPNVRPWHYTKHSPLNYFERMLKILLKNLQIFFSENTQ